MYPFYRIGLKSLKLLPLGWNFSLVLVLDDNLKLNSNNAYGLPIILWVFQHWLLALEFLRSKENPSGLIWNVLEEVIPH